MKRKHHVDEEERINIVPKEIKEYEKADIFSKEKYDQIENTEIDIKVIGEIELSREERLVLTKHPKFA